MHWIARHILKQLAFADSLTYSELKPDSIEGNLFQYHARHLEKQALITRSSAGYQLTGTGRQFVADLSAAKLMQPREQPRIMVAIAAVNSTGQWLLFRWRRHPYRNRISLPMGRHFVGRSAVDMAAEQLFYKSGYSAQFVHLGDIYVLTPDDHFLTHIFQAHHLNGTHGSDGLTGQSFWDDPHLVKPAEAAPGFFEIINWIENPQRPSFTEFSFTKI